MSLTSISSMSMPWHELMHLNDVPYTVILFLMENLITSALNLKTVNTLQSWF